nr:hypothetical protein [Tanacetum cinerariifolium]
MLIPNDLLTDAIRDTQAYKYYEAKYGGVEVLMIQSKPVASTQGTHRTPRAARTHNPHKVSQRKKGKRVTRETSSPRPSLKIKTAKGYEKQQNVVAVEEKILEDDVEKVLEGEEEEFDGTEFTDMVLLSDEDFDDRLEPESHKDKSKEINDDDHDEKKDDKKDDD